MYFLFCNFLLWFFWPSHMLICLSNTLESADLVSTVKCWVALRLRSKDYKVCQSSTSSSVSLIAMSLLLTAIKKPHLTEQFLIVVGIISLLGPANKHIANKTSSLICVQHLGIVPHLSCLQSSILAAFCTAI